MNEQLTPNYEHNPGTRFDDGDTLEIHAANPDLMTLEELQVLRRRQEFERQALDRLNGKQPERAPTPSEWVGQVSHNLKQMRQQHLDTPVDLSSPDFRAWEAEMQSSNDSELLGV